MNSSKKQKALKIVLPIFIVLTIISVTISLVSKLPKKELISTKTYDIYELSSNEDYIYYSYIDENKKINKDYFLESTILKKIYMGEKNQVTVEYWGRNGKIKKVKLIKFHVDEETYKEFSEKYEWKYNMGSY